MGGGKKLDKNSSWFTKTCSLILLWIEHMTSELIYEFDKSIRQKPELRFKLTFLSSFSLIHRVSPLDIFFYSFNYIHICRERKIENYFWIFTIEKISFVQKIHTYVGVHEPIEVYLTIYLFQDFRSRILKV